MFKSSKFYVVVAAIAIVAIFVVSANSKPQNKLPLIAIANYGPHPSLFETIEGIKDHLKSQGYIDGKNIRIEVSDVNYDTSIIIQMLSKLKASKPKILVAISTPVAQSAKNMIKDIPVVFADVTDPLAAGLAGTDRSNVTGASDMQDTQLMFELAKQILPNAKKMGVLYSTGEANDKALIAMLQIEAAKFGIEVLAVPVEHTRDVATRLRSFNGKVDFIYAGSSGTIQASLPAMSAACDEMMIPLFNFNSEEVVTHQALASYGVSHTKVGANAAKIIIRLLAGEKAEEIDVIYPSKEDHLAYVSKKKLDFLELELPQNIANIHIQE